MWGPLLTLEPAEHLLPALPACSTLGHVVCPEAAPARLQACTNGRLPQAGARAIGHMPLPFLQEEDKLLVRKREFKDKSKQRKAYATHGLVR